jgi:hypothetical protein
MAFRLMPAALQSNVMLIGLRTGNSTDISQSLGVEDILWFLQAIPGLVATGEKDERGI